MRRVEGVVKRVERRARMVMGIFVICLVVDVDVYVYV